MFEFALTGEYLIKLTYRNRIEYSVLIEEIIESMQMMRRNEHRMY